MSIGNPSAQNFRDALETALRGGLTWLQRDAARSAVILGLIRIPSIRAHEAVQLTAQWLDEIEDAIETERAPATISVDDYERESAMEFDAMLSAEEIISRARKT